MTIYQEMMLSIIIATFALVAAKLVLSALPALG
jgi:hypothetical protein